MNARGILLTVLLLLPMSLAIQVRPSAGQSLWSQPCSEKTVGLEVSKPFFDGGNDGWSALSSASYLSVHWPLSERIAFVGELPVAYGSYDPKYEGMKAESKLALGNPYVGVKIQPANRNVSAQVGLRLPLVQDLDEAFPASTIGMLSDFVSRSGAYLHEVVPVTGTVSYREVSDAGVLLQLTGGADTWVYTGGGSGDDIEVFGLYGVRGGYHGPAWSVTAGVAGRMLLSEKGLDLGERTTHEAGLEIGFLKARIQPTLYARVPVDKDLGNIVNTVIGIGLRTRI